MMCTLHCKGAIDGKLTRNEEDLTNHDDVDIHILPVSSDSENSYFIWTAPSAFPHTTTPSLKLEKLLLTQIAKPTLSASSSDFNTSL